jgi:exonuclease III
MAWNANSVTSKKRELEFFLYTNKIDIAAISETKMSTKNRFSINGYSVYRQDRNKFGGGVMLLINNQIQHDQFYVTNTEQLETVAAVIHLQHNEQLLIVSTYLPPSTPVVRTDLDKISSSTHTVLVRDLNSKHTAWNCSSVDSNGKKLLNYCIKNNLSIHYPDQPTHYPHNSAPSVLDIAITKLCSVSKPTAPPITILRSQPHCL